VLAHFLIPGDRLTLRKLAGVLIAYAGIILLFARQIGRGAPTLLGDAIMVVSAFVLAERTVYLAGAVRRFDPVKLLLSQALIGTTIFVVVSLVFESSPTRWTGRPPPPSRIRASSSPASTSVLNSCLWRA